MSTTFFKLTMYSGAVFALADHSEIHLPIRSRERQQINNLQVGTCQNDCFDQHDIDGDGHCFFHAVGAGADDNMRRRLEIADVKAGAELRRRYVEYVKNNAFNPTASADLKYAIRQAVSDRVHGAFRSTITDADLNQWEQIMYGGGPAAYGDSIDAPIMANMFGVTIIIRHQWEYLTPFEVKTPIDVPSRFDIYLWKTSNHYELLSLKSERDMVHVGGNNTQAPVDDELARAIAMSLRDQEQPQEDSLDDEMKAAFEASLASEKADEEKRVANQKKEEEAKRVAEQQKEEEEKAAEFEALEVELETIEFEALALIAKLQAEDAQARAQMQAAQEAKEAAEKKKREEESEALIAQLRAEHELALKLREAEMEQARREQEAKLRKEQEEEDAAMAARLQAEEWRPHYVGRHNRIGVGAY